MTSETAEQTRPQPIARRITEEAVQKAQILVGRPQSRPLADWEVPDARFTRTAVKRLAVAIGDFNPIYMDPAYAQRSIHGIELVPPGIVIEAEQLAIGRDVFPGARAVLGSCAITWERRLKVNDAIEATTTLRDLKDGRPTAPGRAVVLALETQVINQRRELVATVDTQWSCYERGSQAERALYQGREPALYDKAQVEAIHGEYKREYDQQLVRGAEPRPLASVKVGDEIPYILKGPTTTARRVALAVGGGVAAFGSLGAGIAAWYHGLGEAWAQWQEHPDLFYLNEHGAPEPIEGAEWSHPRTQKFLGLPGSVEDSRERIHWNVQLLTNWMGDEGFLKQLELQFPALNLMGDITRCYGRVTATRKAGAEHLVEVALWNDNHLGIRVTTGRATVALPAS